MDNLTEKLAGVLDRFKAEFIGVDPDWKPLFMIVPAEWVPGFMFMGRSDGICLYKHGVTRRYLNIDSEGNTYSYSGLTGEYLPLAKEVAVKLVYKDIETMGATPETAYDASFRAGRNAALVKAGYTVVGG